MLLVTRLSDASLIAQALGAGYPSYVFDPIKPRGCRRWRIAVKCRATGAFLKYAEV